MSILQWLGRLVWRKKPVDREKTTKHFQAFKDFYQKENEELGDYDPPKNFLVKYIATTKKSPFVGDEDLAEAKKFWREAGAKDDFA